VIKWRDDNIETHGYFNICVNSLMMTSTYSHLKDIIDLWWTKKINLQFIPLIIGYRAHDLEQVYNKPELREDCLFRFKEALEYITNKECEHKHQEGNKWSMQRSLMDNIEYLENIIKGAATR